MNCQTIYFAGALFDHKQLTGNALLAEANAFAGKGFQKHCEG